MAGSRSQGGPLRRGVIAVTLTGVAGFVDAFGYLTLDRIYTANMSGNTVALGVHLAEGGGAAALVPAYTVAMFLLGLLASGIFVELALRRRIRRILAGAMALEVLCLGAFILLDRWLLPGPDRPGAEGGWPLLLLIAIAAVAMGLQNTSLRMAGILTVYTTHVTGTITRLSEDAVALVFATVDRVRRTPPPKEAHSAEPPRLRRVLLSGGLWLGFLVGAVSAGVALPVWGTMALLVPIATLAVIGGVDWASPLASPRDERSAES